jgi:hypothetical protein
VRNAPYGDWVLPLRARRNRRSRAAPPSYITIGSFLWQELRDDEPADIWRQAAVMVDRERYADECAGWVE